MTIKPDKPRSELRVDRLSVFRMRVVDGNFKELKASAKNDSVESVEDFMDSSQENEFERLIYNFLSSFVGWKKKAKKIAKNEDVNFSEEDIEHKLNEEIQEGKRYFLEELRNFLNHKGEINLGRNIDPSQEVSEIIIGIDDELARDIRQRSNAGGRLEKAHNYFKENRDHIRIIRDLEDLNRAIRLTDEWINRKNLDVDSK
jgi:hypothetical protein